VRIGVAEQAATGVGFLPPIEVPRRHDFKSAEQAVVILWRGFAARRFVAGDNDSSTDTRDDSRVFVTGGSSGRTSSPWLRRAVIAVTAGLFVAATITPIITIFMPAVNGWLDISPAMAWPEIAAIDCAALSRAGRHQRVLYRSKL
jgi:hypothetical protein